MSVCKNGNNQYKRAFKDNKIGGITDAKNPTNLAFINEPQKFTIVRDPITKFAYVQILPNRRQKQTDRMQLRKFHGYRIVGED
jgi:hypothetical protein